MTPPTMTAAHLIIRREALGLTQGELADRLGVARETVWRWEMGKRKIPHMLDLALQTLERQAQVSFRT